MTRSRTSAALLLLAALALPLTAGCASETADDETSEGALTEYDAVVKNGTKVEASSAPTESESARTRLVGFLKGRTVTAVSGQLLKVAKWKDIEDSEGNKPFTAARVTDDDESGGTRTLNAHLTLDGGVELDVRATARQSDGTATIAIVNTSEYRHWLAGKVLDKGKLKIDVKIAPHTKDGAADGVIVDATAKVKLNAAEDKAPGLTKSLVPIFGWLKSTTQP